MCCGFHRAIINYQDLERGIAGATKDRVYTFVENIGAIASWNNDRYERRRGRDTIAQPRKANAFGPDYLSWKMTPFDMIAQHPFDLDSPGVILSLGLDGAAHENFSNMNNVPRLDLVRHSQLQVMIYRDIRKITPSPDHRRRLSP